MRERSCYGCGWKTSGTSSMRILLAVEFYYAPGGGGIQEQVRRIAEGLVTKGNEVTVATSYVNGRSSIINGVKIVGFNVHGDNGWALHGDKHKYVKFLLHQKRNSSGLLDLKSEKS